MAATAPDRNNATTAARSVTDRFLKALEEHVTANHDVAFYADYLRVHPDYLTRCVKAAAGAAPKAIIQRELASRAQELLRAGTPVGETATALGFGSSAYFSRFYRRVQTVRPSDEHSYAPSRPSR